MVSERRERAQVILIGAIALAFILLGIVVVFNGVLYTETLASGGTSQSANDADVVELEVEQGVGCLLEKVDNESSVGDPLLENHAEDNITAFSKTYQNSTLGSKPVSVSISDAEVTAPPVVGTLQANVTITYESDDLGYEQNRTIEAGCP